MEKSPPNPREELTVGRGYWYMASIPVLQMMIEIATGPQEGHLVWPEPLLRKLSEGYKLSLDNLVGISHMKEWSSSIPAKKQE